MQFKLAETTQLLGRTPATLTALVGGMPESWLKCTEGAGTWSAYDVVGHLIHGEMTDWIPRARMILEHGESKAFEPFDRVAMFRDDQTRPISALLDQFAFMRGENIAILNNFKLTDNDLARRGTHPELGTGDPGATPLDVGSTRHDARFADCACYGEAVLPRSRDRGRSTCRF